MRLWHVVLGLGDDARWVRFELASGFSIVSDVEAGHSAAEWIGNSDRLVLATSYSVHLEVLWTEKAS
jgi:hypothetical protein